MIDTSSRLLLTEGRDDEHVIRNLLGHRGLPMAFERKGNAASPDSIRVKGFTGYTELRDQLAKEVASRTTYLRQIGVVIDHDNEHDHRWTSIRGRLLEVFDGLSIPDSPPSDGFVGDAADGKRVGVWLMPDNASHGALEHFYKALIRTDNGLLDHAHVVVDALPERPFETAHPNNAAAYREKAIIHTWLAWHDPPGRRMGEAFNSSGLFTLDCALADAFVAWTRRLFEMAEEPVPA